MGPQPEWADWWAILFALAVFAALYLVWVMENP